MQSDENGEVTTELFDFGSDSAFGMHMKVDIGSAAYWSELMQVQTMDNLFAKGVITDVLTYLEGIPEQYLRNKSKLIAKIKNEQAALLPMNGAMNEAPAGAMPPADNIPMMQGAI